MGRSLPPCERVRHPPYNSNISRPVPDHPGKTTRFRDESYSVDANMQSSVAESTRDAGILVPRSRRSGADG